MTYKIIKTGMMVQLNPEMYQSHNPEHKDLNDKIGFVTDDDDVESSWTEQMSRDGGWYITIQFDNISGTRNLRIKDLILVDQEKKNTFNIRLKTHKVRQTESDIVLVNVFADTLEKAIMDVEDYMINKSIRGIVKIEVDDGSRAKKRTMYQ